MLRRTVIASAVALGIALATAAEDRGLTGFLGRIATEQPSVKWDAKSAVQGDFDGSHRPSFAVLGYKDERVIVAVSHKTSDGTVIAQYLGFGIDHASQDSICKLPAHLEIHALNCVQGETQETLPGCKEAPGVSEVDLVDGECDPIYMYWSHSAKKTVWWRY